MIHVIIPSLDRACQLESLLRSIRDNWSMQDLFISILYKWSTEEFRQGYEKLIEECSNWSYPPLFNVEKNFCSQVKKLVSESIYGSQVVGFFTDDCAVFREVPISVVGIQDYFMHSGVYLSFSLRLGENTIVQNYLTGELQPPLNWTNISSELIRWRWSQYPQNCNWNYPFSWDGHFYDSRWLYSLIENKQFESPRALEHQLSVDPNLRDIRRPYIAACRASSVFVNTVNRVQPCGPEAGTKHSYSPEFLNSKWLSNQRISLRSFEHLPIISSHEEFSVYFEENL